MLKSILIPISAFAVFLMAGCTTPLPPGAEPGPNGTMAYSILIESTEPGARVEVDGNLLGETPLTLKVYGDRDGTFHDFGSPYYTIRALPLATNHFAQTRSFRTGQMFNGEDRIPQRIFFDMTQPQPVYVPVPVYVERQPQVYFGTDVYFGPRYYYDPYPRYHHHYERPRTHQWNHPHLPVPPHKALPGPHRKK